MLGLLSCVAVRGLPYVEAVRWVSNTLVLSVPSAENLMVPQGAPKRERPVLGYAAYNCIPIIITQVRTAIITV